MGYGNFVLESQSPRWCYSTAHYNARQNDDTNIIEEKLVPNWFYLPYCDECEQYREFVNIICSHHQPHRFLVTCTYCQIDFRKINEREIKFSVCCRSIERKLKTYIFAKLKNLANEYNIKR